MAASIEIVDGPSKYGLIESLTEGDSRSRHEVYFKILAKVHDEIVEDTISGWVNTLGREDGSSFLWNVNLYLREAPGFIAKHGGCIKFQYDARKRKGMVQL
ncbi:MAG: hypothetical protein WCP14_02875 [bacterium]